MKNYKCVICEEKGFIQRNDIPYIEAHHIIELHKLMPGSYCSDNIIIVCSNCHKKLHYAKVTYSKINNSEVTVKINDCEYNFNRTIISD